MALVLADRVQETCNSPGTGAVTLLGAVTGFQSFSAGIGNGNTTYYAIADQSGANWEVGIGSYSSSGNTLTRTTVLASSNGGSATNFSSGTQNVWCDLPASRIYQQGLLQAVQTANFTAAVGNSYPVNTTSGSLTVTLPASPLPNQQVNLFDYAGTFATNPLTINPNGNKLNGLASSAIVTTKRESITLIYVDSTQGWVPIVGFNTSTPAQSYTVSYLVVAGAGGGGGNDTGGGGGAGGVLSSSTTLSIGNTLTITVGSGGAGGARYSSGSAGSNSSITSISTATGGGYGGGGVNGGGPYAGGNGGSGGGGGSNNVSGGAGGGSGTSGQGNAGGTGAGGGLNVATGGGGGGAGAAGGTNPGNGGNGVSSSITGTATYYGGGGGGGFYSGISQYTTGGLGGGASGNNGSGGAGTANTGGGGAGGGTAGANAPGGNGGSGVVILSLPTSAYSGNTTGSPTVTTSGSNTILTFTASGTYTA